MPILYEREQRVALRDDQWEITDVRAARGGTLLLLRVSRFAVPSAVTSPPRR